MSIVPTPRRHTGVLLLAFLLAAPALAAPVAASGDDGHGVYRLVEGAATVEQAGLPETAEENWPLLTGDRLTTARGAHVEVELADATVIRVGGDSELVFSAFAGSGDGDGHDSVNVLFLERGELLLASEGGTDTRIDTDNATVYVGAGSYRIERGDDSTLVIARRGAAALRTRRGAMWVLADEQGWVEGDWVPVVEAAGGADALERWAATLDDRGDRFAGLWPLLFGDGGGLDLVFDDFGVGGWDDGTCSPRTGGHPRTGGGAARTRPPHPPADPPRVAVPIDRAPDGGASDVIGVALPKPWPLDDSSAGEPRAVPVAKPPVETSPSDSWVAASPEGEPAEVTGARLPPADPSDDEASRHDGATPSDEASSWASSSDDSSSTSAEPSSSDDARTDSPAATVDSAPASQDTATDTAPAQDSSGGDAVHIEARPDRDPDLEPNR